MPHRPMNLKQLAAFLGIDTRQLEKMVQKGQIPAQKVAGEYRFNRAEITEWLPPHLPTLTHDKLADVDAGLTAHREIHPEQLIVTPLLHPQAIDPALPAGTKNSVLRELVSLADKTGLVWNREDILEALLQREELQSTALEAGIAVPHPRRPLPYAVASPIVAIAKTTRGIGFGAPDGRLTDLFFLLCCQDDRQHLHVLARICRMCQNAVFLHNLRSAQTPDDFLNLLKAREAELL